ncbi:hypothetical protein Pd630_LPD16085 (plasmid) [Rhodococcus opacus PD630]|nr:hypothetical protein Pd630_LPD16085 [Rhodococcus opacus PD630]
MHRHERTSGGVTSIGRRGHVPDPPRKVCLMFTSFVTPPEVLVKV